MAYIEALEKLRDVARIHRMYDGTWISELDEFDEAPLFYSIAEVEFLLDIDTTLRGSLAVQWAAEVLDAHAHFLETLSSRRQSFLCITFRDFDQFAAGEAAIPTPSLLMVPNAEAELVPDFRLGPPVTSEGLMLWNWLTEIQRSDLLVAESSVADLEFYRAYLGYRNHRDFRSVSTYYGARREQ